MNLTAKTFFKYLDDFVQSVESFITRKDLNEVVLKELITDFDTMSAFLITSGKTPDAVKKFLSEEHLSEENSLPEDYSGLNVIFKLRNYVTDICTKNIKKALKDKDYPTIFKNIAAAVKTDLKNTVLIDDIADIFQSEELYTYMIDLYRVMFVNTTDPIYFEKIGDIYLEREKYSEAIDSYLNYAETTEDNVHIYEKLADVFGRVNDNDSRLACLEHIKNIGGSDV